MNAHADSAGSLPSDAHSTPGAEVQGPFPVAATIALAIAFIAAFVWVSAFLALMEVESVLAIDFMRLFVQGDKDIRRIGVALMFLLPGMALFCAIIARGTARKTGRGKRLVHGALALLSLPLLFAIGWVLVRYGQSVSAMA